MDMLFIILSTPKATPTPLNFPSDSISAKLSYLPPPPITTLLDVANSNVRSL